MADQSTLDKYYDEFCHSRKKYRTSKKLTAVKAYSIAQESKYLLIENVHSVGTCNDLLKLCALYGPIEEYRLLDEASPDPFIDMYWIKYTTFEHARCFIRLGKRQLDDQLFYGKHLRVSFAVEYESIQETKQKLLERKAEVERFLKEQTSRHPSKQGQTPQHQISNPIAASTKSPSGSSGVKRRRI